MMENSKYLGLARQARAEGNSEDAKVYYNKVREENPEDGEAKFFYTFYAMYEGKNGEIPQRFGQVCQSVFTAIKMVKNSDAPVAEQKATLSEIVKAFVPETWSLNRYMNKKNCETKVGNSYVKVFDQNAVVSVCKKGMFAIRDLGNELEKGMKVQAIVKKDGQSLRRVPSYATKVVQDEVTYWWCAEVCEISNPYDWEDTNFKMPKTPLIYECHVGMAQDKYGIGTYREFADNILPRVKKLGYNTVQIMAIMEHPYYGSFGYQVSNFFAPSSRFGSADDLKYLINTAHKMGIAVLLDIVHSHAVGNTNEGLNLFDGTDYQYFHAGGKGDHPAWGTKLFNYAKNEVIHFLLSNVKYWLEEFHFDGFRFDGVTSMLYHDHGLGSAFVNYDMYFSMNTDTDAITYLMLANDLIKEINPKALTIAEDMSGMPGMCLPIKDGGIGFDYRLSMGVPDLWIKYLKDVSDDYWNMGALWWELNSRRPKEKVIGYCESHDQALVGDKTIMFRLCDANMYSSMNKGNNDSVIFRGIALHK